MKVYPEVPQWWFYGILVAMVALSIGAVEGYKSQLQLPWWGILFACALACFFTLPIGVIAATTNQVRPHMYFFALTCHPRSHGRTIFSTFLLTHGLCIAVCTSLYMCILGVLQLGLVGESHKEFVLCLPYLDYPLKPLLI